MNNLCTFYHKEFGSIRTIDINHEIWFVGKDIADILEYKNGSRDINVHVDEEDRLKYQISTAGQMREQILINESGLYSLILSSKLPNAKKFKHWVTSEVLPSIRKTGKYFVGQKPMSQIEILQQAINLIAKQEKTITEHDNRINILEKTMADIKETENLKLDNWRLHIRPIVNKIAQNYPILEGINESKDIYKLIWHEIYDRLEAEMRCNLQIRLTNMKMRSKKKGATQNTLAKLGYLDVIQEDPKLISGMKMVLRKMMIKYC